MRQPMNGFSLMEMVVGIVVMGILAAIAAPSFSNVIPAAANISADSVGSALVGAAATNYANCELGVGGTVVNSCTAAMGLVQNVDWTDYLVLDGGPAAGGFLNCYVQRNGGANMSAFILRSAPSCS